jgi:integrase
MKNKALTDTTIKQYNYILTNISKHADLDNPETVEQYIANHTGSNTYKRNMTKAYQKYCQHYQIKWQAPKYTAEAKTITIPTEEKLEMLIANAGYIMSVKLGISKETGLRPIELCNLKVKDIDLNGKTIHPTTAKHGSPRTLRISNNLANQIADHITRKNLNPNDRLFNGTPTQYGNRYQETRNLLAKKLHDPSLRNIRLYDFRHFFATALYHKTKDILYVKQQMGHKRIETTLIYTQLLDINEDEWTCRTASTIQQDQELIESGFEYLTERDGTKLYRKRK